MPGFSLICSHLNVAHSLLYNWYIYKSGAYEESVTRSHDVYSVIML